MKQLTNQAWLLLMCSLLVFTMLTVGNAQECGCLNCEQPIPVFDNTIEIQYNVQGLLNEDLSGSQCVAAVNLQFQHNRIQNLELELISPSGQVLLLVGPSLPFGGGLNGTIGAQWNVNFVQCFPNALASPDPMLSEVWNSAEPGWNVFGGNFTGTYYPALGGCLESFNLGAANGIWTLRIRNAGFPPIPAPGLFQGLEITFCEEEGRGCCGDPVETPLEQTICQSESFDFNGEILTTSGIYRDTLLSSAGCDSIVVLDLQVSDAIETNLPATICSGDSFNFNGAMLTASGIYRDTLLSSAGCDSILILDLQVSDAVETNLPASICSGETFDFSGTLLTASGIYRDTLLSSAGCDSILILDLQVSDAIETNLPASICSGETFDFNGTLLTASGIYRDTLSTSAGCDSILILDLQVSDEIETNLPASICSGDSFDFNGEMLTASGIYRDTLSTSAGCDSILILDLQVSDVIETNLPASICSGDSFNFNGEMLTISGIYRDTLLSSVGCDSILILDLQVSDVIETNLPASICSGDSFDFNGTLLTASGIYRDTLSTSAGCDSILILDLQVSDVIETNLPASICQGETFDFNGEILTASGIYRDTLSSVAGCDSILILDLQVSDVIETNLPASICSGDSFDFNGTLLTASGIYRDTLSSVAGCDSIVVLDLQVSDAIETNLPANICSGDSFDFNGDSLTVSGIYRDTLLTSAGCDSILILDLQVLDVIETNLPASICQGEPFDFNGEILTASGIYRDTLSSVAGCDSIVVLDLQVSDMIETNLPASICSGDSFDFNGTLLTASGIYRDTVLSVAGCDSIVVLDLQVSDAIETNLSASICSGDSFDFNGEMLTASGIYRDTLSTSAGCDSILILDLQVSDVIETNLPASICSGENFDFNGEVLTVSGIYRDTLSTSAGCDSILILNLQVSDVIETNLPASICSGDSFDFNGEMLTISGIYRDTLLSGTGCDSIVILDLQVSDALETNLPASICQGETFDFNGEILTASGIYRDTLSSVSGCDSIVVLDLQVLDLAVEIQIADVTNLDCLAEDVRLIVSSNQPTFTYQWFANGMLLSTDSFLVANQNQTYSLRITDEATGCTASDSLNLQLGRGNLSVITSTTEEGCTLANRFAIAVDSVRGGTTPYLYSINQAPFTTIPQFTNLTEGVYEIVVQDAAGCEWDTTITLQSQNQFDIDLGEDQFIKAGDSLQLQVITNEDISSLLFDWATSINAALSCKDCPTPTLQPAQTVIVRVLATSSQGCQAEDEIVIFVDDSAFFYAPNSFSPNGDGVNDSFDIYFSSENVEQIENFSVLDRWGNIVAQQSNINVSVTVQLWDGTSNGLPLHPNVFVYQAQIRLKNGQQVAISGEILLMR